MSAAGCDGDNGTGFGVDEDSETGAVAKGVFDGGCCAVVGTGTRVNSGFDIGVEANSGVG